MGHFVITGVTSGLGQALAENLAQTSHHISGCGRSAEKLDHMRNTLKAHLFGQVDVTDATAVENWATTVTALKGAPDCLVVSAGLIHRQAALSDLNPAEIEAVLRVNLIGTIHTIRAFLPAMAARGHGMIVVMSSYWGRHGEAGFSIYCASKFAIEGLCQSIARELPAGLGIVAIDPGSVATPMLHACLPAEARTAMSPNQWAAKAANFFLSLDPTLNGQSLTWPQEK